MYKRQDLTELLKTAGFQIIVTLPTVMLMLVIASACKNLWVCLGIGVILVFTLSILPQDNIVSVSYTHLDVYKRQDVKNGKIEKSSSPNGKYT